MNLKQFGVLLSVSAILGMNVIANKALAEDPSITFGMATASGECIIDTDGRTLSLIFNKFSAFSGERKRCIVRVNTTIPSGFRVQNVQVLYQGSTEVGLNSEGTTFSRSYSFSGGASGQIVDLSKINRFKSSEPLFHIQDDLTVLFASCGGQGQLGFNLIEQSTAESNIVVDTANIILHFNLSPC